MLLEPHLRVQAGSEPEGCGRQEDREDEEEEEQPGEVEVGGQHPAREDCRQEQDQHHQDVAGLPQGPGWQRDVLGEGARAYFALL